MSASGLPVLDAPTPAPTVPMATLASAPSFISFCISFCSPESLITRNRASRDSTPACRPMLPAIT